MCPVIIIILKGWVVDEHAANWSAIQDVFGVGGVQRTVSCEFHFKQSLVKQSKKVNKYITIFILTIIIFVNYLIIIIKFLFRVLAVFKLTFDQAYVG